MEEAGLDSRQGSDNFSPSQVLTSAETNPVSYPKGTSGSLQTIKRTERETDHSLPSSDEDKYAWSYASIYSHVLMV
jgi:hypothetical protein